MKKLKIFLSCDADPDQATQQDSHSDVITWKGLEILPKISEEFRQRKIKWTLFVRADDQITKNLGTASALFNVHEVFLKKHLEQGNEVAWHPHLYRWDLKSQRYHLDIDPSHAVAQLEKNFGILPKNEFHISTVRLGEAWHSNETMGLLSELGFKVDSTAIPGRFRQDAQRSFDWRLTPNRPYHPRRKDYKVEGEDPLSILEVPMTTAFVKTDYDQEPLRRYINPAFHGHLFQESILNYLQEVRGTEVAYLVLIFHPGELLGYSPNGLYAYSWDVFLDNLNFLKELPQKFDLNVEYCCLREAARSA